MVVMILPAWLLAMLPGLIGGIVSGGMQAGAVSRANRYNDPRSQLARLNAAGLPFAAFTNGQAGNQSSIPDVSQLGSNISDYMSNRIQQEQAKLLKEQIRNASATADMTEYQRDIAKEQRDAVLMQGEFDWMGQKRSLAYLDKERDYRIKKLDEWFKENDKKVKEVESQFRITNFDNGNEQKKLEAEIDKLILSNDLARQALKDNETRTLARNQIIDMMKDSNGKLSLIEAITIQIMNAMSGGLQGLK